MRLFIYLFFYFILFSSNCWAVKPIFSKKDDGKLYPDTNLSFYYYIKTLPNNAGTYNRIEYTSFPFLHIRNLNDNEDFISPYYGQHNMRFSGASRWSKAYAVKKQTRLLYLGYASKPECTEKCYVDSYIKSGDFNITKPFIGIACRKGDTLCDESSGAINAENYQKDGIDINPGFYHTFTSGDGVSAYPNALLSNEAKNIIKNLSVGQTINIDWVFCTAYQKYYTIDDYNDGKRCKDITGNNAMMMEMVVPANKMSELTLSGTNAFEDIAIDTSGNSYIMPGSTQCRKEKVNNIDGIICSVANYSYKTSGEVNVNQSMLLFLDQNKVKKLLPKNKSDASLKQIAWKTDNSGMDWVNVINDTSVPRYKPVNSINKNIAKDNQNSSGKLNIFFPDKFLKILIIENKVSLLEQEAESLLSFQFYVLDYPESGYYEFLPFTHINLIPKEHSISIHPKNSDESAVGKGAGIIGSSTPIDIQYKIISSYSNQEFLKNVSLSINGAQATAKDEKQYCAFTDINGTGATIAVPQYVKYQTSESDFKTVDTNCKEDGIGLTPKYIDYDNNRHGEVYWEKFDWKEDGTSESKGTYARTYIDLVFPMDDPISKTTIDGSVFEGTVQSTGTLEVTATWNDVP